MIHEFDEFYDENNGRYIKVDGEYFGCWNCSVLEFDEDDNPIIYDQLFTTWELESFEKTT